MKRRSLLQAGAVLGASALWPVWIARAFDPQAACGPEERLDELFDAYRSARRYARPLLVLVIPEAEERRYERGALFGAVLNHGDDETLAALSRATLVCATMTELRRLVPNVGEAEPLLARVDTARRPARTQSFDYQPGPAQDFWQARSEGRYEQFDRGESTRVDNDIRAVGALIRSSLADDTQAETAPLRFEAHGLARALQSGEKVEYRAVLRAAADLTQLAAIGGPADRMMVIHGLAEAMRESLREPVPGSRWAHSGGCGTRVEGAPLVAIGCGMGHVPEKSRRFLYFFAKLPYE